MSLVRKNIIANLVGSGWIALISIAFIPFYIHFLGVEAYGLIGFYLILQGMFSVLDMGLTATVSRELARLSVSYDKKQEMRNLVRTLEVIYWALAVLIMSIIFIISPWITTHWLNVNTLSEETVQQSILLMGFIVAVRMPYGFYSGGLLGLQRQVLLNVVKVTVETLKSGGAVIVLWLLSPSVTAFFLWQLIVSTIGLCLMAVMLWRCMPKGTSACFQSSLFRGFWRFSASMGGISILAVILTQADKLILSKMLSLETFAYYALASTVAMGLYVIISPIFSAVYPKFTQLVADENEKLLIALYHKSCQFMTVLVMPLALVICFFSEDILFIWTQDAVVANHAAPILSVLIIGTALNGMMNIPYALQLAYGWTKLAIYLNVVAIIILVPALILTVSIYGALGGAMVWLVLNLGYIFFGLYIMHGRLLKNELYQWFVLDFGVPSLVSAGVVSFFWIVFPVGLSEIGKLLWVFLSTFIAWGLSAIAVPNIRHSLLTRLNDWKIS